MKSSKCDWCGNKCAHLSFDQNSEVRMLFSKISLEIRFLSHHRPLVHTKLPWTV